MSRKLPCKEIYVIGTSLSEHLNVFHLLNYLTLSKPEGNVMFCDPKTDGVSRIKAGNQN